jgi:hypothetical protein
MQRNQATQQLTAVPVASSRSRSRRIRGRTGPLPQQQKVRVPFKELPHAAISTTQDIKQGGQRTEQWEKTAERYHQQVRQQITEEAAMQQPERAELYG